ncbi:hypothetical protein BCR34DRAFT_598689, partial [Clohesyomyces aquaticus]
PKKKKSNAVFGFLTLKEPSQSALEQFAEQQRKQAAEKGAKPTPAGLTGISPQKLPPTVPKVNSKWDGVPETVKARDSVIPNKRNSTLTQASRFSRTNAPSVLSTSSGGSQGPPNSYASSVTSLRYSGPFDGTNPRRDPGPSIVAVEGGGRHARTPSTTSLPDITYFFPDNPNPSGVMPGSSKGLAVRAPTLDPLAVKPNTDSIRSTSAVESPGASNLESLRSLSLFETPTSSANSITAVSLDTKGFLAGEAQEFKLPGEESPVDEEAELLDGQQDIVFADPMTEQSTTLSGPVKQEPSQKTASPKPATFNFSRPLSVQMPTTTVPENPRLSSLTIRPNGSELPILYEISSSEDTIASASKNDEPFKDSDTVSIAPSVTPSVTPSVMSASWYQSPRERLGLGGRIRKNDVLPWESHRGDFVPGKKKKKPISQVFSRGVV